MLAKIAYIKKSLIKEDFIPNKLAQKELTPKKDLLKIRLNILIFNILTYITNLRSIFESKNDI